MTELSRRQAIGLGSAVGGGMLVGAPSVAAAPAAAVVPPGLDPTDPVELARAMIRIDTSNLGDTGNTLPYARMLEQLCGDAGMRTDVVITPHPNDAHFVGRVAGQGHAEPLMFMGHSDVVTAQFEQWSVDPFGAEIKDGWLYGRGAVDMKGTNAAFLAALLRHVREGAVFDRDVIYYSDCDEEGGSYGTDWFVPGNFDKVDAGVLITEGGWTLCDADGVTPMLATLTAADRRSIRVQISAHRIASHSSKPYPNQAVPLLGRALGRLDDQFTRPVLPNRLSREHFAGLARATGDRRLATAIHRLLHATSQRERNEAGADIMRYTTYPRLHNGLLRTTLAYVAAAAGYYPVSIIPSTATAQVLIAFQPQGEDPRTVLAELRSLLEREGLDMQVVLTNPGDTEEIVIERLIGFLNLPMSTTDTDVFRAWQHAIGEMWPGIPAVASQFEARTSAAQFQERSIPMYGIYPYPVDEDTLARMHGVDERVRVDALRQGSEMFYRLLARFRLDTAGKGA
jgi:acetylornithine deacetylase/succinyl-diaminopimelate desuccinylase-like protein